MEKCEKCLYYKSKEKCGECGRLSNVMDNKPMFTPNTNYNCIKSMSVEEMANFLSEVEWKAMQGKSKYTHEWEQWLLQEVSENDR